MLNKIMLIGRLGVDPEIKFLDNDRRVANFSLATSEKYYDSNKQLQEKTEWHRIVCWNNLVNPCEYIAKGSMICVIGKVTYRSYEDNSGIKRYVTEIIANEMKILSYKEDSGKKTQENEEHPQDEILDKMKIKEDDEIPF